SPNGWWKSAREISVDVAPPASMTRIRLLSKSATYALPSGPRAMLVGLLKRASSRGPSASPLIAHPARVAAPSASGLWSQRGGATGGASPPASADTDELA